MCCCTNFSLHSVALVLLTSLFIVLEQGSPFLTPETMPRRSRHWVTGRSSTSSLRSLLTVSRGRVQMSEMWTERQRKTRKARLKTAAFQLPPVVRGRVHRWWLIQQPGRNNRCAGRDKRPLCNKQLRRRCWRITLGKTGRLKRRKEKLFLLFFWWMYPM